MVGLTNSLTHWHKYYKVLSNVDSWNENWVTKSLNKLHAIQLFIKLVDKDLGRRYRIWYTKDKNFHFYEMTLMSAVF